MDAVIYMTQRAEVDGVSSELKPLLVVRVFLFGVNSRLYLGCGRKLSYMEVRIY